MTDISLYLPKSWWEIWVLMVECFALGSVVTIWIRMEIDSRKKAKKEQPNG